ncbi:MAG: hypothetical protein ABWY20_07520 [Mycobacterium sp.]
MNMIMHPDVEDLFRARSFAIIQQFLLGDLEAVLALVRQDQPAPRASIDPPR